MIELSELLKQSPDYFSRFEKIRIKVTNVSGRINALFPTYTNHDVNHLEHVEEYANRIIPDEVKNDLNIDEIFFLLCGIWLHDMGMVFDENEINEFNAMDENQRSEFAYNIRLSHNIRSETYIYEHSDELGLGWHEAVIIGKIAKGHRQIDLHNVDDENYKGSIIRVSFLSAVLRLADECHVDESRESSLSKFGIDKKIIHDFYLSHEKIDHVGFDFENENILISCKIENKDDLNKLIKIKSKIQEELDGIVDILKETGISLNNVRLEHFSNKLIEKEIILYLSNGKDTLDEFEIDGLTDFKIDDTLNKLCSENKIIKNGSKFKLNKSIDIYEKIFKEFEEYGDLDEFYFTDDSQEMIPELMIRFNEKFNAFYLNSYDDRVKILKNSPTAAKFAFNFEDYLEFPNFDINSNQNGELIFDYLLLMSIFNDVRYYKNKISFDEVESAITKLNWNNDDILSKIHQYKNFDKNKLKIEDIPDNEDYPISLTVKFKSDDEDVSKVIASAFKSGNPAKFLGDRVLEVTVTENGVTESYSPDALIFSPSNISFDLKLGQCWYNDIEFKRQELTDKKFKFTSVSDKIDVIIEMILEFDENNKFSKFNLKISSKSHKIKDMLYFYLFTNQHSLGDIKIYCDNLVIFEDKFPKNEITEKFIEKYRRLDRINDKLNLNLTHNEGYMINDEDFEFVEMINSKIETNCVETSILSKPVVCSISELKEFLSNENNNFSFKLNCCVTLLGKNIDLGRGNVDIDSLCIINKDELLTLIEAHDDNDEVETILTIGDNNHEKLTIKF